MSSDMNLSSILQSEIYCAPSQVVLIDTRATENGVSEILKSLDISSIGTLLDMSVPLICLLNIAFS